VGKEIYEQSFGNGGVQIFFKKLDFFVDKLKSGVILYLKKERYQRSQLSQIV
jgi:hypothetical protein